MSQTLTSPEFRQTIFNYLYAPTAWSAFATFIAGYEESLNALAANTSVPSALALQLVDGKRAYNPGAYAGFLAIACGDSLDAQGRRPISTGEPQRPRPMGRLSRADLPYSPAQEQTRGPPGRDGSALIAPLLARRPN